MKQHIDYIVHGFVQGVGFRYFVYQNAVRLNLTGFTKNNYDGSVSVTAEGEEQALAELLIQLKQGPSRARITKVETIVSGYSGLFIGFEIK